jgi:ATP-dependent exoDNAse (exonuclease V) alpha subunit
LGGDNDGQVKIIPRIKLSTTEGELPFILTRKQFPVRLCFAMTVNKAQGQSLDIVGIDLRTSSFTHGQLYVALSRATDVNKLRILQTEERGRETENIVYPEVLLRE